MEEQAFRVLLDFTEVNSGESDLKYVWMFVSPRELKTIFDFKRALIKKFSFSEENFKLYVRDGLLLENEKIGILRENDTVKLLSDANQSIGNCSLINGDQVSVTLRSNEQSSFKNSVLRESKKRKSDVFYSLCEENSSSSDHQKKKKKKHNKSDLKAQISSDDLTCSAPESSKNISEKQSKNKHSEKKLKILIKNVDINSNQDIHTNIEKNDEQVESTNRNVQSETTVNNNTYQVNLKSGNNRDTVSIQNKLDRITKMNTDTEASEGNTQNIIDEISSDSIQKKKKRKRKRKRKDSIIPVNFSELESSELKCSFESASNTTNIYDTSSDIRKHIVYRSPTPPSQFIETVTIDENDTSYYDLEKANSSSNIESSSLNISALDSCVQKFVQEEAILKSASGNNCESVITKADKSPRISTPFSKKEFKEQSWGVTPLQKVNYKSNDEVTELLPYANCTPLTYLPPVGTHLAYRTLELNEQYCPEVTNYKEGIVKKVDTKTDELEIELLQEEIKPGRTGKFENLKVDEIPSPQIIKTVSLNWTALIEPKLVSKINL